MSLSDRPLLKHLLPVSACATALLALGLTPYVVTWLSGYGFLCPTQGDMPYYLQLAAQPYYNHSLYLSDPMIQGGPTFYPWLQYIPLVCLTRLLGLPIFAIQVLWTIAAALGTSLTLYLLLWLVCRNRWLAAAITICAWADIDLGMNRIAHRPLFIHQIYLVASDLIAHLRGHRLVDRPWFPWQWRLTNPALDFPFLFLQLIATSIAREHPNRRNLVLSGLVLALTFYIYFYLWTMIAVGLGLAILVDRPGRRTYVWTLALGFALGWPQIAHDYLVRSASSAEGLRYFGLTTDRLTTLSKSSPYFHPYLVIGELVILGVWITRRKVPSLVLTWCITCAGVGLSLVNFVTSVYLHNYHWSWLVAPLIHILMVAVALDLIMLWKPRLQIPVWVGALFVCAFLASGIYLTESTLTVVDYDETTSLYSEYVRQRLSPGVTPLKPGAVIAGEWNVVDLAAIAERQRPLRGRFLDNNVLLDDKERRDRFVLDHYLSGIDTHDDFAVRLKEYFFIPHPQLPAYLHTFDEVSRDPDRFIDDLKVRYLVLPATQPIPKSLSRRWNLIQPGPYFRIWEWTDSAPK